MFDRVSAPPTPTAVTFLRETCPWTLLNCLHLPRSKTPCLSIDSLSKNPGDAYASNKFKNWDFNTLLAVANSIHTGYMYTNRLVSAPHVSPSLPVILCCHQHLKYIYTKNNQEQRYSGGNKNQVSKPFNVFCFTLFQVVENPFERYLIGVNSNIRQDKD